MSALLPRLAIATDRVGKRFGRHWIIERLSLELHSGEVVGIRGSNGSGKSTLLRMLCGQLTPSRGVVSWKLGAKDLPISEWYQQLSWTGPYTEIIEELTVQEMLGFHFTFKPLLPGLTRQLVLKRIDLEGAAQRPLRDCSSGMRQRVLLATALYANTPLLLLDEPTVTLDERARAWFQEELAAVHNGRLVVIASNDPEDLQACQRTIDLNSLK